jgi:hypothetical protein
MLLRPRREARDADPSYRAKRPGLRGLSLLPQRGYRKILDPGENSGRFSPELSRCLLSAIWGGCTSRTSSRWADACTAPEMLISGARQGASARRSELPEAATTIMGRGPGPRFHKTLGQTNECHATTAGGRRPAAGTSAACCVASTVYGGSAAQHCSAAPLGADGTWACPVPGRACPPLRILLRPCRAIP